MLSFFFLNCLVTSQRSSSNHNMPAGEVTESAYNYGNKWCKSGVRGSRRGLVLLHAMSAVGVWRYKINRLTLPLVSLPFSRPGVSRALATSRTNIMQDLITKWSVPTLRWLLLFMGSWRGGGLRDTETTQQLRLRWMLVYTYSPVKVRGFLLYCRGLCERRKVTFSLHHKGKTHTLTHTHTDLQKQSPLLSGSISLLSALFFKVTHSLMQTPEKKSRCHSVRCSVKI